MPEALPELVWFALLFFCFAFVWAARKLLTAMLSPIINLIGQIPLAGSAAAGFLVTIEQDIDSKLGSIEGGIDSLMGSSFHRLAELNEWLWTEFKRHTTIGWLLAQEVSLLTRGYEYLKGRANHAVSLAEAIPHDVRRIEREFTGIEHRVKTLEHKLAHGIGDDVLPRLKSLDKELGRLEHKTIPAIRAAEADAESAISDLYSWARGKAALIGVGTFAFAIAAVIGNDVFNLLKCDGAGAIARKYRCGLWNLLGNLLGLAAFLTIAFDFRQFVNASEEVATFIGGALGEFEGAFPLSLDPLPPPNS